MAIKKDKITITDLILSLKTSFSLDKIQSKKNIKNIKKNIPKTKIIKLKKP